MFPKVVMCLRYAVCAANVCNYFELRKNRAKKNNKHGVDRSYSVF